MNLYSIPFNERPNEWDKLLKKKKLGEGSDYMGRILLSINLSPNEKPEKAVKSLGGYREPII